MVDQIVPLCPYRSTPPELTTAVFGRKDELSPMPNPMGDTCCIISSKYCYHTFHWMQPWQWLRSSLRYNGWRSPKLQWLMQWLRRSLSFNDWAPSVAMVDELLSCNGWCTGWGAPSVSMVEECNGQCNGWGAPSVAMVEELHQVQWLSSLKCNGWGAPSSAVVEELPQLQWLRIFLRCNSWGASSGTMVEEPRQVQWLRSRVFAKYQVMLGWQACKYYHESNELPNPRPTQPKKN